MDVSMEKVVQIFNKVINNRLWLLMQSVYEDGEDNKLQREVLKDLKNIKEAILTEVIHSSKWMSVAEIDNIRKKAEDIIDHYNLAWNTNNNK